VASPEGWLHNAIGFILLQSQEFFSIFQLTASAFSVHVLFLASFSCQFLSAEDVVVGRFVLGGGRTKVLSTLDNSAGQ
jgi:hypothetical protein